MTMGADRLDAAKADAMLVEGIQTQTVKSVAQAILDNPGATPEAQHRAQAASAACMAISAEMRELRAEVIHALEAVGIAATPHSGREDEDALQFHLTAVQIEVGALPQAVETLQRMGFRLPLTPTPARLRIWARTATALRFVRFDDVSARVDLRFATRPASRLPKVLHPRMADLGMAALPKLLAPLYWGLRPLRLLRDRLTGTSSGIEDSNLLGTPGSLISPLLAALELTERDVFVDLGCGDGRVVAAAAALAGQAIGYEIDPALVQQARERSDAAIIHHMRVEDADLSEATAVFCFLPKHYWQKLQPTLSAKLPAGARIIAHEQTRIPSSMPAQITLPVFGINAMTVLHVWTLQADGR